MSLITVAVLVGLAGLLLAGFTLISQSLEQKKSERRLLASAMQRRLQQLLDITTQMPKGYLSPEVEGFLHHNVVDCCRILLRLEKHPQYQQLLVSHEQQIQATTGAPSVSERPPLQNAMQIKEVKSGLNDVMVIIANCVNNGTLSKGQAVQYKQQLQRTLTQVNLESYKLAAQQAIATDKLQVALHYYQQGKKMLGADPGHKTLYERELADLEQKIQSLTERMTQTASAVISESLRQQTETPSSEKELHQSSINADDAQWKKKQIYD